MVLDIGRLLSWAGPTSTTSGAENGDSQGQRRRICRGKQPEEGQDGEIEKYKDKMPEHRESQYRLKAVRSQAVSICTAAVVSAELLHRVP